MTILTRRATQRLVSPLRHSTRKSVVWRVKLVRPPHSLAAIQRGRRLATSVRKELATLDNESLDATMAQMRGRAWS
ncbi:MAG: hypothetical protein HZC40_10205 [Chloroflexi bacterium]|nr:hypothetical protein [Chloroflexota bacterium]